MTATEREQKALKIAELEGWKLSKKNKKNENESTYKLNDDTKFGFSTEIVLVHLYSSFNGLMPIVERVNKEKNMISIIIYSDIVDCYILGKEESFKIENNLIDALQKAIIYIMKIRRTGNEKH